MKTKYKIIFVLFTILFLLSINTITAANDTDSNYGNYDINVNTDKDTNLVDKNTYQDYITNEKVDNSHSNLQQSSNYKQSVNNDCNKQSTNKEDTTSIENSSKTVSSTEKVSQKSNLKNDSSNTYYVSTTGKSSNDGSSTSTWDIETGLNKIQSYNNSKLIINSGNYKINETITINSSIGNFHTEITSNGKVTFNSSTQILKIATKNIVSISNITFNNGYSTENSGVFYNEGNLELINCNFNNNTAYRNGAVVYNNGSLTVTNCSFDNNIGSNGGAIYNYAGDIIVTNSTFSNHMLTNGQSGGAIYNNNNATITNCKFYNNTCNFNGGGALFNNGSCIFNYNYIENCYGLHGGAIYNSANISIDSCTFINNTSLSGSVIYNTYFATINNTKMQQNNASTSGGAIYNMENTTIYNSNITSNYAKTGGAIYNALGEIRIENCNISKNSANQAAAIYNKKNLFLFNNTIEDNFANDTAGIYNAYYLYNHAMDGASFYIYSTGNITAINNRFTNNTNLKDDSIASTIQNYGYINLTNNTFTNNRNTDDVLIYNNNTKTIDYYNETVLGGTVVINNNTFYNFTKLATNYGNMTIANSTIMYASDGIIDNYNILELRNNNITDNTIDKSPWIINNINTTSTIIIGNIFNNNTKNNKDVLLSDSKYISVSNNTYNSNMLSSIIKLDDTLTSYNLKAIINTRDTYNTTVNTGIISVYDKYNNIIATGNVTNGVANLNLTASLVQTSSVLTVVYTCNDKSYQSVNSTIKVDIPIKDTKISLEPISSMIGENITLKATILDIDNNPVTGGNLVFKLNGKTLRIDGSFNSTEDPYKFQVVNGTVTFTMVADLYLRNAKNLTASYSGSTYYIESKSPVVEVQLSKRNALVDVSTNPTTAKEDENIEFTINITDSKDSKISINNGYVLLKINEKTLLNENGSQIQVQIKDNIAKYNYTIPRSTASVDSTGNIRDYNVTAIFVNDDYYSVRNYTKYNIEKSSISIDISSVTVSDSKMNITALIKNENNNTVAGNNKICIKVNGKTLRDSNNNTIYYTVTDGVINLTDITVTNNKIENITIVTGERQAYTSAQTTYTNVKIV